VGVLLIGVRIRKNDKVFDPLDQALLAHELNLVLKKLKNTNQKKLAIFKLRTWFFLLYNVHRWARHQIFLWPISDIEMPVA
jgi:hypothetical protein